MASSNNHPARSICWIIKDIREDVLSSMTSVEVHIEKGPNSGVILSRLMLVTSCIILEAVKTRKFVRKRVLRYQFAMICPCGVNNEYVNGYQDKTR
jgi:hypothetical protein